jgi:predicted dehydrogenase
MIKACIIGCGKIADAHAIAIHLTPDSKIVGVCDKEELVARQLAERFRIERYFSDIRAMLQTTNPDVVHITTPPQSHYEIGKQCLEAGVHAFIEKPFTMNSHEAEDLLSLAKARGLKLTVGNDEQFSHVAIRMRSLVQQGYLGGPPVHMDCYYCYDMGDERFASVFLGQKSHWVRKLPGQLLHNIISHGIVRIAEFLQGENVKVVAQGFTSDFLKKMGESVLIDEARVVISDGHKTTAYFTFSTQIRPSLLEFRIYGPKNGLIMDQKNHSLIKISGAAHKSYLQKIVPLHDFVRQYRRNMFDNIKLFLRRDFGMKTGLKNLIGLFYRSISEDLPVPISYKDILLTTRIMDEIFTQVYGDNNCVPQVR